MLDSSIKIAVIGGGISGLGTALSLLSVPGVTVNVYEKAKELREIGGGLNVGPHKRDVLRKLGADSSITGSDMFPILHRKGSDGDLLCAQKAHSGAPDGEHQRVRRSALHKALLDKVPDANIHLNKGLESVCERGETEENTLNFSDGTAVNADLVIGAAGVRSRVREYAFPESPIKFIGVTAYEHWCRYQKRPGFYPLIILRQLCVIRPRKGIYTVRSRMANANSYCANCQILST
ncbi:hypothetical protein HBI56_207430 [Parastagonospora nodorum]|nr:hypothetical protein HBI10_224480 [Parastagonospora nodorum]KAH4009786.1 hypothetical protein HBI13_214960 [Parastagonospora nodorum]KAH4155396.1 hypothetical protein HBH43_211890 [Parastagonospora nodorum]KAH4216825.1 hypothetical protein HBI06_225840 [Parastagonospora nodorum]KAH4228605.1 hypothetical protein HBI05_203910 [Parastagonospora nodorum]